MAPARQHSKLDRSSTSQASTSHLIEAEVEAMAFLQIATEGIKVASIEVTTTRDITGVVVDSITTVHRTTSLSNSDLSSRSERACFQTIYRLDPRIKEELTTSM